MFCRSKKNIGSNGSVLMKCAAACVVLCIVAGLIIFLSERTEAFTETGSEPCRGDRLCQSLKAKEFDLIKYSSMGSQLVILYDRDKTGDISVRIGRDSCTKEKGTIYDALRFLQAHPDYKSFMIRRGRKTVSWFRAEVMDGVYVVEPEYLLSFENSAPRYNFSDSENMIEVFIRPVHSRFIIQDTADDH